MKTDFQKKRERREEKIYQHYMNLLAMPGAMKTACQRETMKKFDIANDTTIRSICKRVEQRQNPATT